jgi:ribonuclease BN (tRNA processing enzyme)
MPHGRNKSSAYRIDEEGRSVVYMTDIEHKDGKFNDEALRMAEGVHTLIHDTQFTPEDYAASKGSGHSSMETAVAFAREAGVRQLVMFHYHPDYDDDQIRNLYERFKDQDGLTVIAAQEGLKLVL